MTGLMRINKTGGLLTVDGLSEITMEEVILDVHLPDGPIACRGEAEDHADHGRLDDGAEDLPRVNTGLLREAPNHPPRLVARQGAIRM